MLAETSQCLPRKSCHSCDCFQGFVTQLEIDAEDDAKKAAAPFKVDRSKMHRCLGCDPCPPGNAYSRYLKRAQQLR